MRTIKFSATFRKDWKKTVRGTPLEKELEALMRMLAADMELPPKHRDHALAGTRANLRDCHLRPDVVVIYEKTAGELGMRRIGSRSELFGK